MPFCAYILLEQPVDFREFAKALQGRFEVRCSFWSSKYAARDLRSKRVNWIDVYSGEDRVEVYENPAILLEYEGEVRSSVLEVVSLSRQQISMEYREEGFLLAVLQELSDLDTVGFKYIDTNDDQFLRLEEFLSCSSLRE